MPVLVLQALAEQGRAAGRGAEQEAAGPGVGGLPDEVADPLEPEHRIERVEGHDGHAAVGVARGGGDEAGHRAGFGDPLLEDLTLRRLGVAEQQVVVDGLVLLAERGVDLELAEERVHPERAGLVGDDRHDARADVLVAGQVAQQPGEAHRRADFLLARSGAQLGERLVVGELERAARPRRAAGERAAERLAPLHHVLELDRVLGRLVVRRVVGLDRVLGDLVVQVQPVAEGDELVLGHLLDLVGGVAALEALAEGPALDRLGQDHGGRAAAEVLGRRLVGGVELAVVVAAAGEVAQLVVGEVGDHLPQPGVGAEEVVPDVLPALDRVALELAVDGGVHLVDEHAVLVLGEQLVPLRAPDHLDHVPAGAAEHGLELLDDLAVAAHRAVEALEVAVDDEDQVVELLAGGERDRPEGLGLVDLAVADEAPHPALAGVVELAVQQVAVEAGVVEGRDRAEAHAHRRELPEVGHQAGVRVARQAAAVAADLLAEVVEVVGGQAALDERPRVDAGGGVALDVDVVAGVAVVLAAEEVVEPDLVQARRAGERREVPADAVGVLVRLDDHHRRVPADEGPDAALDVLVAGEPRLLVDRDRVDVGRADRGREADLGLLGALEQLGEEVAGAHLAVDVDHGVEGVEPLPRLARIGVRELVDVAVEDHGDSLAGLPAGTHRVQRSPKCELRSGYQLSGLTVPDRGGRSSTGTVPPCPSQTRRRCSSRRRGLEPVVVYTDGACSGNPGPGGWAWAVAPDGERRASGGEPMTTNQRMEITAVLEALRALSPEMADGRPVEVVSDSTYVVNCFRDRWYVRWQANGWRNARKAARRQRRPVEAARRPGAAGDVSASAG